MADEDTSSFHPNVQSLYQKSGLTPSGFIDFIDGFVGVHTFPDRKSFRVYRNGDLFTFRFDGDTLVCVDD